MDTDNLKTGMGLCIALIIWIGIIYILTFVLEIFGDDKAMYYMIIILGIFIFWPLINVVRGKITFREWIEERKFAIGLIVLIYLMLVSIMMMKYMLGINPAWIWINPITFIVLMLVAVFWFRLTVEVKNEEEEETEEDDS